MAGIATIATAILVAGGVEAADKSGVKPEVLSLPSGPGSIEGLGESFEPQLNTGSSSYRVPIAVPPGRAGHEPKLALTYNSGSGNGHFGLGWSLPLPYIQRQTDKGQPSYTDSDVFVYSNGEELVPLEDGTWRCENESEFMRFKRIGDGWEVRDRSGRIYRLGQFPESGGSNRPSRVGRSSTSFDETFKWYVTSLTDTNGNQVEYFYSTFDDSPGQLYLTEIRYNELGIAYNSLTFVYEQRTDAFTDYRPGFKVRTGRRGSRIQVRSRNSLVREYLLQYEDTADEILDDSAAGAIPSHISLLTKVTQFDDNGVQFVTGTDDLAGNYLPPLRMGYTRLHTRDRDNAPLGDFPGPNDIDLNGNGVEDGSSIQAMASAPGAVNFQDGNADFLDVNGDGLPDVFHTTGTEHNYYLNSGTGAFEPVAAMANRPPVFLASSNATLADLDGDGLSDLVNKPSAESLVFYRNRGDGSWAPGIALSNPMFASLTDPDVKLVDVDFDKKIDIVRSISGSEWQVCLHSAESDVDHAPFGNFPSHEDVDHNSNGVLDGGAWQCSGSIAMPFAPAVVFSSPGVRLGDMNGDRLQDVVWIRVNNGNQLSVWFYPNGGRGAFDGAVVMAGPIEADGVVAIDNIHLSDVTGDGLSDLLTVHSGRIRLWINVGGNEFSEPQDLVGASYDPASTSIRFADLNGNGSSDLVWIKAVGGSSERFQYLDFSPLSRPNQLKIIDNGLGRRTNVGYRASTEYAVDAASDGNPWAGKTPFPLNVVSRIVTTPGLDVDGKPGEDQYVTDFAYRDPYYDPYEKEYRGFRFAKKIERGDEDAPTLVTRTTFHTGAPDGIDNDGDLTVDERTAEGGVEEEALKGRVLRQEQTTAAGGADSAANDGLDSPDAVVFQRSAMDWRIRQIHAPDGGARDIATLDERDVSFAFNAGQDTSIIELDQGTPQLLRTTYEYDDFGNSIAERNFGAQSRTDDERFTFTEYIHDTDRWIVDRPCQKLVTDAQGDPDRSALCGMTVAAGSKVTESRSYYDGPAYVGLAAGTVGDQGNLTREEQWVEADDYIDAVRSEYDPFGNIIAMLDPLGTPGDPSIGHLRELAYDPTFRTFPERETIHVGGGNPTLVMNAEYDFGFGVMTSSTDFNDNRTTYGYDSFGRVTTITKPLDDVAFPTTIHEYRMADPERGVVLEYDQAGALTVVPTSATASSVTTRSRETAFGGTFDTIQYSDGLGRKLASIEEGEVGFVVTGAVLFNDRASVRDTFQPYRQSGDLYAVPNPTGDKTTARYDSTGRETTRVNPADEDGVLSQVETQYFPLLKSVFDELNNEMTYVNDGLGRLAEVQEVNNQGIDPGRYFTRYTYNPADSLLKIVDAQANVKTFEYDGLQRKVFLNDPNRGQMTYQYDAASNVRETQDAKGQRITYLYDGVNRLTAEDYLDEGLPFSFNRSPDVAYTYDSPAGLVDLGNGRSAAPTQTNGLLTGVIDLAGEEHTSYDERGRPVWVVKRIPDPATGVLTSYKTEMTYDSMDRVIDLIYADNDRVGHVYNRRSLLEQIIGGPSGTIVTNIDYRASGQRESCLHGNGVVTDYAYDPRLRLVNLVHRKTSAPGEPLVAYGYTFDLASNITRIDDLRSDAIPQDDPRRNTQLFDYDDLYRLQSVQYSFNVPGGALTDDGEIVYAYDKIGNMLSKVSTLEHDEDGFPITNLGTMAAGGAAGTSGRIGRSAGDAPGPHALTTIGTGPNEQTILYDDNGNMTALEGRMLSWDFKDRLVAVEDSTVRAEYRYDYTNRRIGKWVTTKSAAGALGSQASAATLYPDRHFEIRPNEQPVKYVYSGSKRIARISSTLDAASERVQRIYLAAGWNLFSLAVDASDAAAQLGIGADPFILDAFRWNPTTREYDLLAPDSPLPIASIVWLRVAEPATVEIVGAYPGPTDGGLRAGSNFAAVPGLQSFSLAELLPPEVELAGVFNATIQEWRWRFSGDLDAFGDAPGSLKPGDVLYIAASAASELTPPESSTSIHYYHQDHLESSNITADANGTLLTETVFHPFGHPRNQYGLPGTTREPYQFAQKELDAESGLQYSEARYRSGALGRFLTSDPVLSMPDEATLKFPQRLNAYAYARSNPINNVDSTGEQDEPVIQTVEGLKPKYKALARKLRTVRSAIRQQEKLDKAEVERYEQLAREKINTMAKLAEANSSKPPIPWYGKYLSLAGFGDTVWDAGVALGMTGLLEQSNRLREKAAELKKEGSERYNELKAEEYWLEVEKKLLDAKSLELFLSGKGGTSQGREDAGGQ